MIYSFQHPSFNGMITVGRMYRKTTVEATSQGFKASVGVSQGLGSLSVTVIEYYRWDNLFKKERTILCPVVLESMKFNNTALAPGEGFLAAS